MEDEKRSVENDFFHVNPKSRWRFDASNQRKKPILFISKIENGKGSSNRT